MRTFNANNIASHCPEMAGNFIADAATPDDQYRLTIQFFQVPKFFPVPLSLKLIKVAELAI